MKQIYRREFEALAKELRAMYFTDGPYVCDMFGAWVKVEVRTLISAEDMDVKVDSPHVFDRIFGDADIREV